jgi:hypothetical protein
MFDTIARHAFRIGAAVFMATMVGVWFLAQWAQSEFGYFGAGALLAAEFALALWLERNP